MSKIAGWQRRLSINMPLKVDLTDLVFTILISPLVWLLVTRAPVLATLVFSSVLITA